MRPGFSFKPKWPKALIQDGWGLSVCFVMLSSLVLVVIWAITMMHIASEKKLAMQSAVAESKNIGAVMAANLNDRLNRTAQYAVLGNKLLDKDAGAADSLNLLFNGDSVYVHAAVFDSAANLVYSSRGAPAESEVADLIRQIHAATAVGVAIPETGLVLVGKNAGAGSQPWRVPLLVRLLSPKTNARGFFVAVLDLGRFLSDYRLVSDGYRVSVASATGGELVALKNGNLADGKTERQTVRTQPGVSNLQKLANYPLIVKVGLDPGFIVADLQPSHYEYVRYAVVISIAVVSLTLILIGISYHRKRLYERLTRSECEKIRLIEQLEKEKTRAYQLASHDYLTGIPNRMLFNELGAAELSRARRSNNLYALFFIDLDGFKPINDTLGHAVGDLLLQAVAQRLCGSLREYDLVARLGGDEFVVLLSDIRQQNQIAEIAGKLIGTVGAVYPDLGGHAVNTSLSIGIALYPEDGHTIDELLCKADTAMYAAKKAGKGEYRFHDAAMHREEMSRLQVATDCL